MLTFQNQYLKFKRIVLETFNLVFIIIIMSLQDKDGMAIRTF